MNPCKTVLAWYSVQHLLDRLIKHLEKGDFSPVEMYSLGSAIKGTETVSFHVQMQRNINFKWLHLSLLEKQILQFTQTNLFMKNWLKANVPECGFKISISVYLCIKTLYFREQKVRARRNNKEMLKHEIHFMSNYLEVSRVRTSQVAERK